MNKRIELKEISAIMEEVLSSGGEVMFTVTGSSMEPMLYHRKDKIVLIKPKGRLKKYDVSLYRRDDGKFIIHRVIKVRKNDYVFCGDNQLIREYGVRDDMVIGVVKAFYRKGKYIQCNNILYGVYKHIWCGVVSFNFRSFLDR